jgi:hypothetical protein
MRDVSPTDRGDAAPAETGNGADLISTVGVTRRSRHEQNPRGRHSGPNEQCTQSGDKCVVGGRRYRRSDPGRGAQESLAFSTTADGRPGR